MDADDIVQSVFGSFFRAASRGYYDLPAGEELWKLFLIIALHKIRAKGAYHRAAKRDIRLTSGSESLKQLADQAAEQDGVAYAILEMTIQEALEQLPRRHQEMLTLRIQGFDVAAIAQRTGYSKRTVERVLQECRQRLADLLDVENADLPEDPEGP
jgi:RNA polymerase sigma factor (sigma-70 family)